MGHRSALEDRDGGVGIPEQAQAEPHGHPLGVGSGRHVDEVDLRDREAIPSVAAGLDHVGELHVIARIAAADADQPGVRVPPSDLRHGNVDVDIAVTRDLLGDHRKVVSGHPQVRRDLLSQSPTSSGVFVFLDDPQQSLQLLEDRIGLRLGHLGRAGLGHAGTLRLPSDSLPARTVRRSGGLLPMALGLAAAPTSEGPTGG
ncbi:MAG: hypothetical protein IPH03_03995 [Tetrasphaera sp.]|nr:hypothetical protein [Tetrasphaera sp.]